MRPLYVASLKCTIDARFYHNVNAFPKIFISEDH